MFRYRLTLAYDGTDFAGWQRQGAGERTVQGVLEGALTRLGGGVHVAVDGAGRTDAGVHALGQVASCSLEQAWKITGSEAFSGERKKILKTSRSNG